MKKLFTLACISFMLLQVNAQSFQFDSIGYIKMQTGKIIQKGETWIIRTGEGNNIHDYFPVNLAENMKINNQDIAFEAALGKTPTGVRMAGTPIELVTIRKLYKTKPKDTGDDSKSNVLSTSVNKFDSTGFVKNGRGKIMKIGETWLIEQNENNNIVRYVPEYLPDDFKIEGLQIVFSGTIGKIDPNVRAMGKPFKIKELMAESEATFDKSQIQEPLKNYYPLDSAGYLSKTEGVIKKSAEVFIIEMDEGTKRYLPVVLPQEFMQENMIVIVSGIIGQIPANVRMVGTPLEIDTIEKK